MVSEILFQLGRKLCQVYSECLRVHHTNSPNVWSSIDIYILARYKTGKIEPILRTPNFKGGYGASQPASACSAPCHGTTNRGPQKQVLSMLPVYPCQACPGP